MSDEERLLLRGLLATLPTSGEEVYVGRHLPAPRIRILVVIHAGHKSVEG